MRASPDLVRGLMRDGIHSVELPDGVVVAALREIPDERGAVLPILRADAPGFSSFGECYFSEIAPGAVKAWKRHSSQTQNLAVPAGRIRMVIYDDREGSATKGRLEILELGRPDRHMRLRIPLAPASKLSGAST